MKYIMKGFILMFLMIGMVGIVSSAVVFTDMSPATNTKTIDSTPTFYGTVTGNYTGMITVLYIDDVNCGEKNCINNTACSIVSTCMLDVGTRVWYWNATDGDGEVKSTSRNIIILGGLDKTAVVVTDIIPIFGGILEIVLALFGILIIIAIVGFVLGLFGNVGDVVKDKVGKI